MDNQLLMDPKTHTFSWEQPLDRERFCLLAQLLYLKNQQQPLQSALSETHPSKNNPQNAPLDDEDASSDDSIEPRQLVSEKPPDVLKRRFLDRLAEILAREKKSSVCARASKHESTSPSPAKGKSKNDLSEQGSSAGQSHTAAASLIEQDGCAIVLVAKNCGLDKTDRDMVKRLSHWIQVMAKAGVKASEKDLFWRKLLLYCRARIWVYVTEIYAITGTRIPDSQSTNTDSIKNQVYRLVSLCRVLHSCQPEDFEVNLDSVSEIACLAYELRSCASLTTLIRDITSKAKILRLKIALLGRYRAAYETFKEAAMHFHKFKELNIKEVDLVAPAKSRIDMPFVTKTLAKLNITPKSSGQSAQSICKSCRLERRHHAEMQILMQIEKDYQMDESNEIYPYIGISKKTCFLCSEVLKLFPFYGTRGSHRKVYNLWDIPTMDGLSRHFVFQLRAALLGVQWTVENLVAEAYHASSRQKLAPVTESSAGVSSETGASSIHRQLRHQEKVKQRLRNDIDNHQHQSKPDTELYGEALRHIVVARLPGNGDSMSLVRVPIVARPEYYDGFDGFSRTIPSFGEYWGWHDIGKSISSVEVKDQPIKSTNGRYYIYWIDNEDLPWNQYLTRLLSDKVAALAAHRKFWCGDVFIVKVEEDEKGIDTDSTGNIMFTNISDEFLRAEQLIQLLFTPHLENDEFERIARDSVDFASREEDRERAKEIIHERM